ncbi:MAG: N-6 DNA methylase [Burkholderiales bacterium 66-5]|nr:MAG: N-6 DNA methylase [Burkholderiales bacterium 66-5]
MSLSKPSLTVQRNAEGQIYSPVRAKWLFETPEERVRQEWLCVLVNEYGYALDQMAEELDLTGRGSAQARADLVIWRSKADKAQGKTPLLVVEYKSDNITISAADYGQGEMYARLCEAPFFVTHNNKETRFWRVRKDRVPGWLEEIESIPHADASDKQISAILERLKVFREDEFADLLHRCHNIIRNRDHLDPAAAFDEIAKILFVKTGVERDLKKRKTRANLFSVDYLESLPFGDPINSLFDETKRAFRADKIFLDDEKINLKTPTGLAIVKELEKYNLSDTSEDIKGIAFERFLGRTFRGEIGQFFTPRPIVEFIIHMLEPAEGQVVCDPASGSGGFLIRFFEVVRQQIHADVDRQYADFKAATDARTDIEEAARAELLRGKYAELQRELDQSVEGTRMWRLANRSIYGTDANERMARTSKMNMIMHGDGHGGVHHHNGFLNVNGIFEGRFDTIITNPPFGANLEPTDLVMESDVALDAEVEKLYQSRYSEPYREARQRLWNAVGQPIAKLFTLPQNAQGKIGKIKTEVLFIERCLDLLKPGGRLGIVLPEGIFNNPSLAYVRQFVEDRARLLAVVSLPQETFVASGASVKCSLLFLQKFTDAQAAEYAALRTTAEAEVAAQHAPALQAERDRLAQAIAAAKAAKDAAARKEHTAELAAFEKRMAEQMQAEARSLLKTRFDYPVFLYEADKVGLTATGEADANELYPNPRPPQGVEQTALEQYRAFEQDATPFFA